MCSRAEATEIGPQSGECSVGNTADLAEGTLTKKKSALQKKHS